MIVNHKYKFIFVKTRKTAGTSIEIALSQFCGDGDIITPITEEDERKRRELGFRGPQNYRLPLSAHKPSDWRRLLWNRKTRQFYNHASAHYIRANIEEAIWQGYFKFCFERDPFDKAISRYYWSTQEPRPAIADYLNAAPTKLLSNWDIYTINDHVAVDFVGRYETLTEDLAKITDRIGLPEALSLPKAKGGYRENRQHYSQALNEEARARVEVVCAKEIVAFAYHWREPDKQ